MDIGEKKVSLTFLVSFATVLALVLSGIGSLMMDPVYRELTAAKAAIADLKKAQISTNDRITIEVNTTRTIINSGFAKIIDRINANHADVMKNYVTHDALERQLTHLEKEQ